MLTTNVKFQDVKSSHRRWLRRHAQEVKGTNFFWHSKAYALGSGMLCSSSQFVEGSVKYSLWYANMANFTMAKVREFDTRQECDKAARQYMKNSIL